MGIIFQRGKIIVTEMFTFIVLDTLKILKLWVGRTEFLKEIVLSCSSTIDVLYEATMAFILLTLYWIILSDGKSGSLSNAISQFLPRFKKKIA